MSFESMMEQLRIEYVDDLPNKIKDIESNFAKDQLQVVREDFHKLKGTGRTYGVPEITDLAEVMEKICIQFPKEAAQTVPEALDLLREIHTLRATAQSFDINKDHRFVRLKKIISQ